MKRCYVHAALAALAALSAPALAAGSPRPAEMAVEIGDLDLATQKGQERLALRVHRAARVLCEAEALDSLPQTIRARRQCITQAQAAAMVVVEAAVEQSAKG